jgi:hypothetical protein
MHTSPVSENLIRRQALKYYLVLFSWPLYLFFLPAVFARWGALSLIYMIFPGVYLFTWVGYLMHESWHQYVPNIRNGFFYNAFALMLLSDPQLYRMSHGMHHSQVHTYQDAEFHPVGRVADRALRVLYNWMEILLGVAWLVVISSVSVPFDKRFSARYRAWKPLASLAFWAVFLGGIGYLSHIAFGVTALQVALSFLVSIWLNSFILHQSQLVEHGNLFVQGTFDQRNVWTRNLRPAGILEKLFLFFTHGDSQEHVLHHTQTKFYLRPFTGVAPMPEQAVYITLREYLGVLGRMLTGKEDLYTSPDLAQLRHR